MTDETHRPYNPLAISQLAESVARALLEQSCVPLPPERDFQGAGIYALFYEGDFESYAPISSPDCGIPIYVGRARPPGVRQGAGGLEEPTSGRELRTRLTQHAASIEAADNLKLNDFRCRYLVVDRTWIQLGEVLLIQQFQPLWNVVVSGFGLHDPGSGRHGSLRSAWDEIHPGRSWRDKMRKDREAHEILDDVRVHLARPAGG